MDDLVGSGGGFRGGWWGARWLQGREKSAIGMGTG